MPGSKLALVVALLAVWLVAGCGAQSPLEIVGGQPCVRDAECKGDRICEDGVCRFPDAHVDDPPPSDDPPDDDPDDPNDPEPAEGRIGDACADHLDCTEPFAFCFQGFPGGYCLGDCNRGCPEGSHCVRGDGWTACMRTCADSDECREGYGCYADRAGGRVCMPIQGGGETAVGGPCTETADCAGEPAFCVEDWPAGYCLTYECDLHGCAEGSTCYPVDGDQFLCFQDCRNRADCGRDDYVCQRFGAGGACVPHCSTIGCELPRTCNRQTGLCE